MKRTNILSGLAAAVLSVGALHAQSPPPIHANGSVGNTVITTTVPFLLITPDSRAGAMGDLGAATTPDANTMHWNPSKLAFMDHSYGFALNYTPWLRALVPDINLSYLSAYKRIDKYSGIGASLRYFSLGDITFTNDFGQYLSTFRPYEMAVDIGYARKLSDNFSIGVAGRFIYSNLAGHVPVNNGSSTRPGYTFAGDISAYYTKPVSYKGHKGMLNFGGDISNLGGKITYTNAADRDFIPANLRIGSFTKFAIDEHNEIGFGIDLNKLLVPSNPEFDSSGKVVKGIDSRNASPLQGAIRSFYDAPGGFSEEMKEINPSIGFEYWYEKTVAARFGYFYEAPSKGDRQYLTTGIGIRFKVMTIDFSYLIPTTSPKSLTRSPLANTLRFSLLFNFDAGKHESL
jgi:hypothetical protein